MDGRGQDERCGICSLGDVAGPPMLACKAEHERVVCVEKIAGVPGTHEIDQIRIPGCSSRCPQTASTRLIKTIFDRATGELIGVHVAGAYVNDDPRVVMTMSRSIETDLNPAMFRHPTLSQAVSKSAINVFRSTHC